MNRPTVVAYCLLLGGCLAGDPTSPRDEHPPPGPTARLIGVAGAGQQGIPGEFLSAPLVVRVLDVHDQPVPATSVLWKLVSGEGEMAVIPGEPGYAAIVISQSDADGYARAWLRPTAPGRLLVEASLSLFSASPLLISTTAEGPGLAHITLGPLFDCTGADDPTRFGGDLDDIRVGTVVEFSYAPWLHPGCTAQIVSTLVPSGGTRFDSGIIHAGDRVVFHPDVAGQWIFEEVLSGGLVVLTVKEGP